MHISRFSISTIALCSALAAFPGAQVAAQGDAPLAMQDAGLPGTSDEGLPDDAIFVYGTRMLGQVNSPQPPILELGAEEIAGYGAGSIAELLEALSPQVNSARGRGGGRPVILVNGVRISSFRELRSYPPEAIQRMEVFPEEVAQRFGYSADQRVVNFILKSNYSSREIELNYGQPWDGGFSTQEVDATYLLINGPSRLNFNVEWSNSSPLTEADRNVVQSAPPGLANDPDPARFRSLVSDTAGVEATINWTTRLGESGNALSMNATFERDDSLRLQGLNTVLLTDADGDSQRRYFNEASPLTVDSRTHNYAVGSTLNLGLGDWQVVGTLDARHSASRSLIDRRVDGSPLVAAAAAGSLALDAGLDALLANAGIDEARTRTNTASALVTATTNPFYLPAGDVSLTLDTGYDWNRINSRDTRNPGIETALTRGDLTGGVNLGIPLTSRADGFLGAVGDFSLNLSAGFNHLSDFGTLYDWSAGLSWGVTDKLSFNATYLSRDSAPTLGQLGNPEIATPNVQVFDLARNETVLATVITGGNPFLPSQSQNDWKVGASWQLPVLDRATFTVDYIRNSSDNVAAGFPVLTPAIEAAFPGRVTRDGDGRLLAIDQRPVSYASQQVERLQFGLNLGGQIGTSSGGAGAGGQRMRGGDPAAGAPPAAPGGGAGTGGGAGAGAAGGNFDPARFAAMRQVLCGADGADIALRLARGESVTGSDGQEITIPPQMLQRLRGDGADVDPEQVEQFRTNICSNAGPAGGRAGAAGAGGPAAGAGSPPAGAGGPPAGAGGGMRGMMGGGGNTGRWFLNLQYTRELENNVLIAPGGPVLDLLDGGALAGGGQPRDAANFRLGMFYRGFGTFVSGQYTGTSTIQGSGLPGSTDLLFDDYATFGLRLFVDLGQQASLVQKVPFLTNTRIRFDVDNVFDTRQRVTDSAGLVPLRYQPFLIDPVGRKFEVQLRKLF